MAETYSTLAALFTDIANAIREKTGNTAPIIADNFPDVIRERLKVKPFKPDGESYLTFSSPNSFTLKINNTTKHWNGTLEYFASDRTWSTWDGKTTLSSATSESKNVLYLRGTGNTVITGNNQNYRWVLTGSNIACTGNIENILDHAAVESGNHPTMANYCYRSMFQGCTSLTQAPALPATSLANNCYQNMFYGCTGLTTAPALPATTLATYCYYDMFSGCKGLKTVPKLPATTLAEGCYQGMFYQCSSLTQTTTLPVTTMAKRCYMGMFSYCTSLTAVPALPATTLADSCYNAMFKGCTRLTQVPRLRATALPNQCYYDMFSGCTSIKLSSTRTGEYTQAYRIPTSGTVSKWYTFSVKNMFNGNGGTFTTDITPQTTYYLSSSNSIVG